MICKLLKQQAAPELELDAFDSNLVDFYFVMSVFKEVAENKVTNSR